MKILLKDCATLPAFQGLIVLEILGKGMHPFANPIPNLCWDAAISDKLYQIS